MCKVKDIDECEKKIFVYLSDGRCFSTEWFADDDRKGNIADSFTETEQLHVDRVIEENNVSMKDIEKWAISRNKSDKDCIYISRHAFERMKQRNGWNKKTALRMVKKVYDNGILPEDAPAEYRPWLKRKEKKEPGTLYKLYGDMVYVFDNQVLITTMQANKFVADKREKRFKCEEVY